MTASVQRPKTNCASSQFPERHHAAVLCAFASDESQVWTYASRVAFVLSVTAKGQSIQDGIKLQRLQQLLLVMMSPDGRGTVNIHKVPRVSVYFLPPFTVTSFVVLQQIPRLQCTSAALMRLVLQARTLLTRTRMVLRS